MIGLYKKKINLNLHFWGIITVYHVFTHTPGIFWSIRGTFHLLKELILNWFFGKVFVRPMVNTVCASPEKRIFPSEIKLSYFKTSLKKKKFRFSNYPSPF